MQSFYSSFCIDTACTSSYVTPLKVQYTRNIKLGGLSSLCALNKMLYIHNAENDYDVHLLQSLKEDGSQVIFSLLMSSAVSAIRIVVNYSQNY